MPHSFVLLACNNAVTFNVGNNKLMGTIPESLFGSTSLKVLDITKNKFKGRIPKSVGNQKALGKFLLLEGSAKMCIDHFLSHA